MIKFNRVAALGIELESGWNFQRNDLIEDIGIKLQDFKNSVCCGELVSKPFTDYESAVEFLKTNYVGLETQEMCSQHIHLSFKDIATYVTLNTKDFKDYFIAYMKNFGEKYPIQNENFWTRIEDRNKFCKNRFDSEQIFVTKKTHNDSARYTVLNFCFGRFRTIESRLLPCFISVDTAIAALEATVMAFESYLELNPPVPLDIKEHFSLDVEDINEELTEPEAKKFGVIRPFNYFMAKGIVREESYGLKELYKDKGAKEPVVENVRWKYANVKTHAYGEIPMPEPKAYQKAVLEEMKIGDYIDMAAPAVDMNELMAMKKKMDGAKPKKQALYNNDGFKVWGEKDDVNF